MTSNPWRTKGGPARSPNPLRRENATLADPQRLVERPKPKYPPGPRVDQEPHTQLGASSESFTVRAGLARAVPLSAYLAPQAAHPAQQQGDVGTLDGSPAGVGNTHGKDDPEVSNSTSTSAEAPGPNQEKVKRMGTANTSPSAYPASQDPAGDMSARLPRRTATETSLEPPTGVRGTTSIKHSRTMLPSRGDEPPSGRKS